MKTKKFWNRETKALLAFALLLALLQGAAILLWRWCNRQFMELMLGGGQFSGDPEAWKNWLRRWQMLSEATALKGYPALFALWIAARFFRKTGRWTPLLALPAGYAGIGLATAIGRLLLEDPSIHVMDALTLARSAGRSAAVLAIGYLLLWLTGRLRRGKEMEP